MSTTLAGVMRPVLVLTHVPHEGPGLIAAALDGVPYRVRTVVGQPFPRLPALDELSGLVVMGGPQDADEDSLAAERDLLARAAAAGVPVLGVCLGMQLLSLALGGRLLRRAGTEVGLGGVDVVADDPVLAPLGAQPTVVHWHADQVTLPEGATLLASTPTTPVQAFRLGSALGLQFHLEVDAGLLELWLSLPDDDLLDDSVREAARAAAPAVMPGLSAAGLAGLRAFADDVRARG